MPIMDGTHQLDSLIPHLRDQYHGKETELVLRPFLGSMRAATVGTTAVTKYIAERRQAEMTNATINRELAILHRAYVLGKEAVPPRVIRVPVFPKLAGTTCGRDSSHSNSSPPSG